MFINHPNLPEPEDDTLLWRYLSFAKLVSLLERQAIFFAGLNSLRDPYEGHPTKQHLEYLRLQYRAVEEVVLQAQQSRSRGSVVEWLESSYAQTREWVYVSCWHMNDLESEALWSLYGQAEDGIAIRTTFKRFREAFKGPREIMGGKVVYLDYEQDLPDSENIIRIACSKRKSFEHEREFRGMIFVPTDQLTPDQVAANGIYVPVDLQTLVEKMYVAPHAPPWVAEAVKGTVARYGMDVPLEHSQLYTPPDYVQARQDAKDVWNSMHK